ncbi:DUF4405 domain-containing protein [Enterocloster bolteae]|uniref:DUF4405 domain-containing protein n=1 Tax=Enterocloster bolteae TaxID=208479 RepID=UPI0028DB71FE|nr:DUF4405 domain-containing protein [Enterocloster bolteae]
MKPKMKVKMGMDVLMTVLLICLMAYQITGQELHEWFGAGMLILFIAHNLLNIRWYGNLWKGKYKPLRILQIMVNFSVLFTMLCLGFSGIIMSRHVFAALPISRPMATARSMHMAASYWGFVLMSVHLGIHWCMITGMFKRLLKGKKMSAAAVWGLRLAAFVIAGYGLACFIQKDIVSYMLLKSQFVFFDFEQGAVSVFTEYIVMMGFWIFAGFYMLRGIGKISGKHSKGKEKIDEKN